jgi:guanyl-specific ribonuclease Sa
MKKALLGVAMMMSFLSFSFAQTTTTKKAEKQAAHKTSSVKSEAVQTKSDVKSAVKDIKSSAKEPVKKPSASARLKKDGTPDRRYKANKKA